jgi:hypothetical protein
MPYQLEGQILEVCDCKVLCPCWIGEDPDNGTCDSIVAYHVDSGTIEGVDVGGLTLVTMSHIPGNVLKGNMKSVIFIDDRATADQDAALRRAFGGQAGGPLADLATLQAEIRWERAPVDFSVVEGHGTLKVGSVAEADMEPYRGPHGQVTTLNESIFSTIPGSPAYVAKASHYRRTTAAEFGIPDVLLSGQNAIQGTFRLIG